MKYAVVHPDSRKTPSTVITCDGKVVWTTPALESWVGQDFMKRMKRYYGARWTPVGWEYEVPDDHK